MELKDYVKEDMGLYDSGDPSKDVKAYRFIDVTVLCNKKLAQQVVVKYANLVNGRIAQLNCFYDKGKDLGMVIHWHINDWDAARLASEDTFAFRCKVIGADPMQLATIIIDNQ